MSGRALLAIGPRALLDDVVTSIQADPLLATGVAVGVVVALVLVWVVIRRLRRTTGERFRRHLAGADSLAILMHPNPDPDAMACAIAVDALADAVGTEASIHYPGQIRHQENRAFETVLDLSFDRIERAADLEGETIALVDHNSPRGFTGAEDVSADLVVDHHPGGGTGREFTDVRTERGACASILADYFEEIGWTPVGPDALETVPDDRKILDPSLSTGLLYGIQSDTSHLTKGCSASEFSAAAYLYSGIDEDKLDRIANPEVDAEVLDVKARAITERSVRNAFAVSDVGKVSNVDAIPQAADELLRLEGITAVVVFGVSDGTVHLSGRSRDDRVHMGKTLRETIEDIPMADAGGHARMGGGQISLDHLEGLGPTQGFTRSEFVDRLFDALNADL